MKGILLSHLKIYPIFFISILCILTGCQNEPETIDLPSTLTPTIGPLPTFTSVFTTPTPAVSTAETIPLQEFLNFYNPVITSDGKIIAFSDVHDSLDNEGNVCTKNNIWIFNHETKSSFSLLNGNEEPNSGIELHFSPDNRYLAALSLNSIWFFDTDDWKNRRKFDLESRCISFSWSPDSQSIVVQSFNQGYIAQILSVKGKWTPLLKIEDVFPGEFPPPMMYCLFEWGPEWSPDGKSIAFIEYTPDLNTLWTIDPASGKKKPLITGKFIFPTWSPNNQQIVLTNGSVHIFDTHLETMNTIIVNPEEYQGYTIYDRPVWSPNGKRIAISVNYENGKSGLFIINSSNGQYKLLKQGNIRPYAWTYDNSLLVINLEYQTLELLNINEYE